MRNTWKLLAVIFILGMYACQENDDLNLADGFLNSDATESILTSETSAESYYEEVDLAVDEGFEFAFDFESATGGRVEFQKRRQWRSHHFGDCVEVDHDTVENVIIIDFGEGCEGRNDVVRSGIIMITYEGDRNTIGSYKTVTFENFFVDGTQIEGIKTHTILDIDDLGNKTTQSTLVGGKLTFEDGSIATRDHEFTRFRNKGESIEESYSTVDGFASGTNAEGIDHTMTIDETLLFQGSCFGSNAGFIPVQGVKTITQGEESWTIDFGDGECDNLITVTKDGESEVIEMTRRGRKIVRG